MSKVKTIQIAFNLEDPYQEKLYNYFKGQGKNASFYGKMLIQKDMEKNSTVEPVKANLMEPEPVKPIYYDEITSINIDKEIKTNMDSAFKLK